MEGPQKLYILVSLAVITILACMLYQCRNSDGFCTCQGIGNKRCPDPQNLQQLYRKGELTEFTDLAAYQNPKWSKN